MLSVSDKLVFLKHKKRQNPRRTGVSSHLCTACSRARSLSLSCAPRALSLAHSISRLHVYSRAFMRTPDPKFSVPAAMRPPLGDQRSDSGAATSVSSGAVTQRPELRPPLAAGRRLCGAPAPSRDGRSSRGPSECRRPCRSQSARAPPAPRRRSNPRRPGHTAALSGRARASYRPAGCRKPHPHGNRRPRLRPPPTKRRTSGRSCRRSSARA
eukprot:3333224-Prymnesium_polylepis.2